ncbi:uncharacterized protein LOC117293917 [Asterias rubens]|uniref:uncharacterized protein LOC117293917 n=1 Tax=Asterias rubens TaxID=7604 RepID=UPI00145590DE|nr:uncharacterized protein LOC117293917 [Asterias rubens]
MDEGFESSDISAAQLAAIQKKGQFARSISLALSADAKENDQSPISVPAPNHDRGRGSETKSASGQGDADDGFKTEEEAFAELEIQEDFSCEESDTSSEDEIGFVEETPLPTQDGTHRRRKTKIQRRRMRHMLRTEFLEHFMRGSDTECDLDIVEGADRSQRVPTLMELCMQKGPSRSGPLPPGLKPVVSQHRDRARLSAVQLRWLCHNLAVLEVLIEWNTVEVLLPPHGVKTFILRRDARSLWRTNVAIYWRSYMMNPPPERHPEEGQWMLPVSLQNLASVDWKIAALAHYLNLTLPHHYSSPNVGTQSRSEESQRQRRVNLSVFQAKQYLQKRYPNLVQHCFDLALAYVWWARGRCTRAQEAFLKVIQQYPADQDSSETQHSTLWARHKAMILADIGRLLVSFGQCDSAGRFYREAVELATRNLYPLEVSKLTLQSLALAASAYDQGLMDRHSAIQAGKLWRTTTEHAQTMEGSPDNRSLRGIYTLDPYLEEEGQRDAVLAAVESLLHCHAGCPTDPLNQGSRSALECNRSWLREARACLEKLLQPRCALVGLYLSMIIAMLGEGVAAENAFNFHMARFGYGTQLPGSVAMTLSEDVVKPHPWWLFLDWIDLKTKALGKKIRAPLRVLPLVWRRGLGHPSYCHDRNTKVRREQAADVQGVTPDLYVTPEGHLSAAMIQNLPPLRTVCLDLYTGKVHFDCSCSEQPHKWDNFCPSSVPRGTEETFANFRINCNQMLPQPIVVYVNPTTLATVAVVVTNGMKPYYTYEVVAAERTSSRRNRENSEPDKKSDCIGREMSPSMSVTFQDATGREKLDIVELYYQGFKKYFCEKTSSWRDRFEDKYSTVVENFIDYVIKKRLDISVQSFQYLMSKLFDSGQSAKSVFRAESLRVGKMLKVTLNNVMYIGKTTVVLSLTSYNYDVFMYLDCTSPSSFSKQVVVKLFELRSPANWHQFPEKRANILLMYKQSVFGNGRQRDKYEVLALDEKGNILHSDMDRKQESDLQIIVGHGDKLLQTTARNSVVSMDFKTKKQRYSRRLFAEITTLAVAQNILFILTHEGLYALNVDTLEPIVVIHHSKQHDANGSGSNDAGLLLFAPNATYLEVLGSHEVSLTVGGGQYYLTFLAIENHVLSLRRRKTGDDGVSSDVIEVWDIMVPGKPTELCYISEQAGFVVSATVFSNKTDRYYRENLYWFSTTGDLIAIHPFLGGRRHGFLPVYLNDPAVEGAVDEKGSNAQRVWHLYFADGLGALCCIKLELPENQ